MNGGITNNPDPSAVVLPDGVTAAGLTSVIGGTGKEGAPVTQAEVDTLVSMAAKEGLTPAQMLAQLTADFQTVQAYGADPNAPILTGTTATSSGQTQAQLQAASQLMQFYTGVFTETAIAGLNMNKEIGGGLPQSALNIMAGIIGTAQTTATVNVITNDLTQISTQSTSNAATAKWLGGSSVVAMMEAIMLFSDALNQMSKVNAAIQILQSNTATQDAKDKAQMQIQEGLQQAGMDMNNAQMYMTQFIAGIASGVGGAVAQFSQSTGSPIAGLVGNLAQTGGQAASTMASEINATQKANVDTAVAVLQAMQTVISAQLQNSQTASQSASKAAQDALSLVQSFLQALDQAISQIMSAIKVSRSA
jgi:hypothetical protein